MPNNRLTKLAIDEVSLVDAPASPGAMVLLRKSATGHLPGVAEAIEALHAAHGDEAVDAFAVALADLSEPIAKAADAASIEDLAPAIAGLHQAIDDIFAEAEVADRADLIAKAQESFIELAEDEILKAAKQTRAGFKACPGCKSPSSCMKVGECAAEAVSKSGADVSGEDFQAMAFVSERIAKAAMTFASLNTAREAREKMSGMIWALQDSVQSIMSDAAVTDKAAMVRQSVAEFDAAIADLTDEAETPESEDMSVEKPVAKAADTSVQDEVKALREQVASFEKAQRRNDAIAKANALLPHGGPVAELADLIEKADEADLGRLTTIAKALTAQEASSAMFGKAMGTSAVASGEPVSPLVRIAKAKADAAARRSH